MHKRKTSKWRWRCARMCQNYSN